MKTLFNLSLLLVVVGAINWGLVGFFDYSLVDAIFGSGSFLARLVYALVGLSGLAVAARALLPSAQVQRTA